MIARQLLAEIRSSPLDAAEVLAAVGDDGSGGTVTFVGTVRDLDGGRSVSSLRYEAHPGAEALLAAIVAQVAGMTEVRRAAAVHRVGELEVGDVAVIVAVSCAHRAEAFEAAKVLIDRVKAEVPIWKLQRFDDGDEEWVGEIDHI